MSEIITSGRRCFELSRHTGPLGLVERTLLESNRWVSSFCNLTWKTKNTEKGRLFFQLIPSESEQRLWQTPTVEDAGRKGSAQDWEKYEEKGQTSGCRLRNQVQMWPTPMAQEPFDKEKIEIMAKTGKRYSPTGYKQPRGLALAETVAMLSIRERVWPTPNARDWRSAKRVNSDTKFYQLNNEVWKAEGKDSGSLNPTWVEWLMGYPLGWTACGVE